MSILHTVTNDKIDAFFAYCKLLSLKPGEPSQECNKLIGHLKEHRDKTISKIGNDYYINLTNLIPLNGIEDLKELHKFAAAVGYPNAKYCFSRQFIPLGKVHDIVVGETVEGTVTTIREAIELEKKNEVEEDSRNARLDLEKEVGKQINIIFNRLWRGFLNDTEGRFKTPEVAEFLTEAERQKYSDFIKRELPEKQSRILEELNVANSDKIDFSQADDDKLKAVIAVASNSKAIWQLGLETNKVFDSLETLSDYYFLEKKMRDSFPDLALKTPEWTNEANIYNRSSILFEEKEALETLLKFLNREGNLRLKTLSDAQLAIGGNPNIENAICNQQYRLPTQNYSCLNNMTPKQAVSHILSLRL